MILRFMATGVVCWGVVQLAQLPWGEPSPQAWLRLSWRTVGEKVRVPKAQDPNLPAHMRLPEAQAFEIYLRPYRLQLLVDGQARIQRRVVAPGFRHDRPLSVFEEVALAPGKHRLEVRFDPEKVSGAPDPDMSQPAIYELELRAGSVTLIGLSEDGAWKVARGDASGRSEGPSRPQIAP